MKGALIALMVCSALLAGCAGKNSDEPTAVTPEMIIIAKEKAEVKQSVKLTENDNRGALVLEKGQRVVVELEENPTTGYVWKLAEEKLSGVVKLVETKYEPYSTEPTFVGGGGKRTYIFEATEYGNAMVKLVYCRPWQCETSTAKEFSVTTNVKEPEGE